MLKRSALIVLLLMVALLAVPAFAAPVPSKTAANQSLATRDADLALVRDIAANDQVAKVLEARGFTQEQINQKLAQLSPQDLHQLAQNLNQLQAAGLTQQEWIWIGIGALAALILIVALVLMVAFLAVPAFASPVPSKTAAIQSIAVRDADLALVHSVVANEQVASALAARGLNQEQVNQKIAQLSNQDLHQLAQNIYQLQAAGLTQQQWIWIGIGALVVLIIVVATS